MYSQMAVMKKYDRESNVRLWEDAPKQAVRLLTAAFSLYCVWVTLYSTAMRIVLDSEPARG